VLAVESNHADQGFDAWPGTGPPVWSLFETGGVFANRPSANDARPATRKLADPDSTFVSETFQRVDTDRAKQLAGFRDTGEAVATELVAESLIGSVQFLLGGFACHFETCVAVRFTASRRGEQYTSFRGSEDTFFPQINAQSGVRRESSTYRRKSSFIRRQKFPRKFPDSRYDGVQRVRIVRRPAW